MGQEMSVGGAPALSTSPSGLAIEDGRETWSPRATSRFQLPDNIAGELVRFLETQIIYGVLPPGARLIEEDVVTRHNVSRSPVREAFRILELEGMVVRSPRRGIRVSEMSLHDVNDLFPPRLVLEGQAAENAAVGRSAAQLDVLRHACETLQSYASEADPRRFFEASLEYTNAIHGACGSRALRRLLDHVGKQAMRYRFRGFSHDRELVRLTASGAASITEAIARRDPAGAKAVTLMLLEQARDRLRLMFGVGEPASKSIDPQMTPITQTRVESR